jgi:carbon monoxide dehydrogenase subunit G
MEISGETALPVAPARVRSALRDPALLARLVDAPALTPSGPGRWRTTLTLGTPPLAQRHAVLLRLAEAGDDLAFDLVEEGKSDGLSINGRCRLEEVPPGDTRVRYSVRARLSGMAAVLGGGAVRRLVDDFFATLSRELAR